MYDDTGADTNQVAPESKYKNTNLISRGSNHQSLSPNKFSLRPVNSVTNNALIKSAYWGSWCNVNALNLWTELTTTNISQFASNLQSAWPWLYSVYQRSRYGDLLRAGRLGRLHTQPPI
jgi:hypothetical protein